MGSHLSHWSYLERMSAHLISKTWTESKLHKLKNMIPSPQCCYFGGCHLVFTHTATILICRLAPVTKNNPFYELISLSMS